MARIRDIVTEFKMRTVNVGVPSARLQTALVTANRNRIHHPPSGESNFDRTGSIATLHPRFSRSEASRHSIGMVYHLLSVQLTKTNHPHTLNQTPTIAYISDFPSKWTIYH
ncbi:hypothetical protein AcV7_002467 [Taiwanofungus camphoratus]|nr:hypothetical protein AcV7_002467 [Antrodia cinnamomea]